MLQRLQIRNYAIIDDLTVDFDPHLNVITGETGAGKSIILGALSLILGERADTSVLINAQEKCFVEAHFETKQQAQFKKLLQEFELDDEPVTIIRREISAAGKSRAFVNDTPVTLNILNALTSTLVDLHRQFDNRALDENSFLYDTLDAMSGSSQDRQLYLKNFEAFKKLEQQLISLKEAQSQWQKEADYHQFLFNELEEANFKTNEIEEAEATLKQISNAEQIVSVLTAAQQFLSEGEMPANTELKRHLQQLQHIETMFSDVGPINQRLFSALEELKDISHELEDLRGRVDMDPERLQQLQERVDLGNRLLKKHGVDSTEALLAIYQQLSDKLHQQNQSGETIAQLEQEVAHQKNALEKTASELFEKRSNNAANFANAINQLLHLIGMPNAQMLIELTKAEHLHRYGKDQVAFLFDANKSGKFIPVQKAASGGELSRIMLSIKALTAQALSLPTLIFDEVDSGISGEAARQVGLLLRQLGSVHQVLCITHQPQVAGKGHHHLYVYKTEKEGKVQTRLRTLASEERVQLIAQMIGGEKPSEAALRNAKELLGT